MLQTKYISGHIINKKYDGIRVFSCVRNELMRLPHFLKYYRSIGVRDFVIIDNDSTDGTREYLLSQPDVHAFYTADSFRLGKSGIIWVRELIQEYAKDRWVFVADADEWFIYPHNNSSTIIELTQELDAKGYTAVHSILLDMYSERSFNHTNITENSSLLEVCPYYDIGHIYKKSKLSNSLSPIHEHFGGMRMRLFNALCCLDKINLFRANDSNIIQEGMHGIIGASISPIKAVTLHFKFLSDFSSHVAEEARRGQHWKLASEYRKYHYVVQGNPNLGGICSSSKRLSSNRDLLGCGLI